MRGAALQRSECGRATRIGCNVINTCFNVAMHGHQPEIYTAAFEEFFGEKPAAAGAGFPADTDRAFRHG